MKTIYKFAIVILSGLLLAAACGEKEDAPEVDPSQKEEVQPVSKTLTFVLPANSVSGKTKWVAGDQIVVHGEYAKDQVTVTLAAENISSDGKTASLLVDGLKPYTREDVTSTLYAGYPADAVNNLRHCFFYTQFSQTNQGLMAACNDAETDTFQFVDLSAAVTFSVNADLDGYIFTGNKKETLGYGVYQVKITSKEKNVLQYVNDPVISIEGKLASGKNTIFVPAQLALKAGLSIKFKKGDKIIKILKTSEPESIATGEVLDLGDVTEAIVDYDDPFSDDILDLDTAGNANCYIVTEPGKYKFKAVYGNASTQFVEDIASASVLWETWNNAEEVTEGSVVASVSYAEDYIILHMPEVLHPGNAVIAAHADDDEQTILWSWHIWVPATEIATDTYGIYGSEMMDRNLGALVVATTEGPAPVESFGLTYQWGRKDPFVGPAAPAAGDNATVAGVAVTQTEGTGSGNESKITLEFAIANPTVLGFSQNGDWLLESDHTLWQDADKTIYDPCPVGYRVPARDANQPFHSSDLSAQTGWQENKDNYWFTLGDPIAVFPFSGYRDDYGPKSLSHAYDRAAYWTSFAGEGEVTANYVNIRAGSAHKLTTVGRARGCSVRCVAE